MSMIAARKEDKLVNYLCMTGHICADINQGALSATLPFLVMYDGYSYTAVAGLVFAAKISHRRLSSRSSAPSATTGHAPGSWHSAFSSQGSACVASVFSMPIGRCLPQPWYRALAWQCSTLKADACQTSPLARAKQTVCLFSPLAAASAFS